MKRKEIVEIYEKYPRTIATYSDFAWVLLSIKYVDDEQVLFVDNSERLISINHEAFGKPHWRKILWEIPEEEEYDEVLPFFYHDGHKYYLNEFMRTDYGS